FEECQDQPWAEGPWCWILGRVRRLETPIPWRGAQGFFDVPDAELAGAAFVPDAELAPATGSAVASGWRGVVGERSVPSDPVASIRLDHLSTSPREYCGFCGALTCLAAG